MPSRSTNWTAFPYDAKAFDYGGAKLKKHWERLHRGDREPFPDEAALEALVEAHPALAPKGSLKAAAKTIQDAWRHYHQGDFGGAAEQGLSVGKLGYSVANKAANIYATYLEHDKDRKTSVLLSAVHRAEEIQSCAPSIPNAWYLHAQALGRYSQTLSVARALADGVGSKIKTSLERALELEPKHADANIALGLYHALVIQKIGSTFGAITYGASKDTGLEHFRAALRLNPDSAIARIEYANGLVMMFGKSKMQEALRLYQEAAAIEPLDAMERLDVELAKSELED
jgi:tetratricopeptide (TPR) repeat protein